MASLQDAAKRKLLKSESFAPPQGVRDTASRALEMRRKYKRGGLTAEEASKQGIGSGVVRATNLASGDKVTYETIKRMVAYFARHASDKKAEGFNQGEKGWPSAGRIAWDLWGGDDGKRWAESIVKRVEKK